MTRVITGRTVLYSVLAFFGVMLAANGIFVYLALSTFNGLDTPDAYRKGLAYNARLEAAARQAALGWKSAVSLRGQGADLRLSVGLTKKDGFAVTGLKIAGKIGRPATDRFDRPLGLRETAPGLYEASLGALEPGNWVVALAASRLRNDRDVVVYRLKKRLWLKPGT